MMRARRLLGSDRRRSWPPAMQPAEKRTSSARTFAHEARVRAFAAVMTFGPRNGYRVKIADCAGLSGFLRDVHAWRGVKRCLRIWVSGQSATFAHSIVLFGQRSAPVARFMFDAGPAWHRPQISRERQSVTVFAQFKKP
jgi:hypothetical protein